MKELLIDQLNDYIQQYNKVVNDINLLFEKNKFSAEELKDLCVKQNSIKELMSVCIIELKKYIKKDD